MLNDSETNTPRDVGGFRFVGPSYGDNWSIENFDKGKLVEIEKFLESTDHKLGGILPRTVVLTNENKPSEIAVFPDELMLDIQSKDYFGEGVFQSVLAHEGSHLKHDDNAIFGGLTSIRDCVRRVEDVKAVFEESPSSFTGLLIKKFGSLENFEKGLKSASASTGELRSFFHDLGVDHDTKPEALAYNLIDNPQTQSNLDKIAHKMPDGTPDPHAEFYKAFVSETIGFRKMIAAAEYDGEIDDYEKHLPSDPIERARTIEHASKLYETNVVPMLSSSREIDNIDDLVRRAIEYRADNDAAVTFGYDTGHKMLAKLEQSHNSTMEGMTDEEMSRHERQTLADHPLPKDRIAFNREREILDRSKHSLTPLSGHKRNYYRALADSAAKSTGPASCGVNLGHAAVAFGQGDVPKAVEYTGAAVVDAASEAANPSNVAKALSVLNRVKGVLAPAARAMGAVVKRLPVLGAVVTAGGVAYEVGGHVFNRDWGKASVAAAAGGVEIAGNMFGFFLGDIGREVVREAAVARDKDYAVINESGLRSLVKSAGGLLQKVTGNQQESVSPDKEAEVAGSVGQPGGSIASRPVRNTGFRFPTFST